MYICGKFIKNNTMVFISKVQRKNGKDTVTLKSITYQINDKNGIHARPAGRIVQCAKRFSSEVTIEKDGKSVSARKLLALMQLGVRFQDAVTVTAVGEDEEEAVQCMYNTMRDAGL